MKAKPVSVRERMEPKTVSMKESEFSLEAPIVRELDFSVAGAPMPHPGLNGKRVKAPGKPAIYFVWNGGYKCWIPNPVTYNGIFRSWSGILEVDPDELAMIATGPALTPGALMIRPQGLAPVYLVTNGAKNWVKSPDVMDYCNFTWPAGNAVVPEIVPQFIPNGITIDYGD